MPLARSLRGAHFRLADQLGRLELRGVNADLPAVAGLDALPRIVEAVGGRIPVLLDGGIRRGADVVKAIALGARGTYIGRAMVYGLGAMGEAGVTKALQIIHKEMDVTMAFCGHTKIGSVDRSILLPGTAPG